MVSPQHAFTGKQEERFFISGKLVYSGFFKVIQ